MWNTLLEWALPLIASGGLGSAITYLINLRSNRKLATLEVNKKTHEFHQDEVDYLQGTLDKYMKDYHEMEKDFRENVTQLRNQIDELMAKNSVIISEKCNEIAALRSKVTYLKGIRCYNFTCPQRIKNSPDKTQE